MSGENLYVYLTGGLRAFVKSTAQAFVEFLRKLKQGSSGFIWIIHVFFCETWDVVTKHRFYHLSIPLSAVLVGETVRIMLLNRPETGEGAQRHSILLELLLLWSIVALGFICLKSLQRVRAVLRCRWCFRVLLFVLCIAALASFYYLFAKLYRTSPREDLIAVLIATLVTLFTFVFIIAILIGKDTSRPFEPGTLPSLTNITEVFATSAIELIDWFSPTNQEYFAYLTAHCPGNGITHHRVLLLEIRSGKTLGEHFRLRPHLDHYLAKCLAEMHAYHEVPLYYMEKTEVLNAVGQLTKHTRTALGLMKANGMMSMRSFDFVLFEGIDPKDSAVVSFSDPSRPIKDPAKVAAYRELKRVMLASPKPFRKFVKSIT